MSVVVFLNPLLEFHGEVGALDMTHEVLIQSRVGLDVEDADGIVAVGLDQVMPIAILVGLVEVGDEGRLREGIEDVTPEGEHRVVDAQCGEDGDVQVGLLDHLVALQGRHP